MNTFKELNPAVSWGQSWDQCSSASLLVMGTNFRNEDRPRELGLLSLEKRSLQEDLAVSFQYLKGAYRKAGVKLFTQTWSDRRRCNPKDSGLN